MEKIKIITGMPEEVERKMEAFLNSREKSFLYDYNTVAIGSSLCVIMDYKENDQPVVEQGAWEKSIGVVLYQKRPVVVPCIQLNADNFYDVCKWIGEKNLGDGTSKDEGFIDIVTLEGNHDARYGDFIIKGVAGEFYPCKPDIHELTYEEVV